MEIGLLSVLGTIGVLLWGFMAFLLSSSAWDNKVSQCYGDGVRFFEQASAKEILDLFFEMAFSLVWPLVIPYIFAEILWTMLRACTRVPVAATKRVVKEAREGVSRITPRSTPTPPQRGEVSIPKEVITPKAQPE